MLLCPLFRLQEAFQECRDCGYITEPKQPFVEIGLKVGLGDVQAGDAETDNHNKAGEDEDEPVRQGRLNGPGARVPVEYYYC